MGSGTRSEVSSHLRTLKKARTWKEVGTYHKVALVARTFRNLVEVVIFYTLYVYNLLSIQGNSIKTFYFHLLTTMTSPSVVGLFDFSLWNGLFHCAAVPVDGVRFQRDNFVNHVVIQKCDERKTALLLSITVCQHLSSSLLKNNLNFLKLYCLFINCYFVLINNFLSTTFND